MRELTTVTVLFCDLVGSTAMAASIGDEAADAVRRDCFSAWRGAAGRTGGQEVKTAGDGMMVAFTSVVSALDCAVAMQRGTRDVRVPEGGPRLKVGVSTGEASREDGDYYGTPVVEAARLCDACAPGQILANAIVPPIAGSRSAHTFTPVGELDLKGLGPVAAVEVSWEVAGAAVIPFPPMLTQARRLPLVGRRSHRAELEGWFDDAAPRRVVLLAGEPGVGKTLLAAEFASWAHERGAIVLAGRCDEGVGSPLQPWVQALGHLAAAMGPVEFEAAAGDRIGRLAALVPSLGDRAPDPDDDRYLLYEAVDGLFASVSRAAPLVMVLDDVHWADASSLQLLRHVSGSARDGTVLVVATYRDTDVDRRHPLAEALAHLTRHGRVERLLVRGLDRDEVGELIASRAGHDAPPAFVDAIATKTEGNPFFADEVLQHLARTGAITYDGARWTAARDLDDLGLPEGIRDVVGRRLSQLSDDANSLLAVAAVAGPEFDLDVVADAARIDPSTALTAAEEALRAVLVVEVEGRVGAYAFTHALVRQTLLEEVSTTRRVRLHWAIGDALERRDGDAAAVAFHLAEGVLAGDTERAARAGLVAGQLAITRGAAEAARLCTRTLALLDSADWPDDRLRAEALIGLARSHVMGMARVLAIEPLLRAARIARSLGDDALLVGAAATVGGPAAWSRFGMSVGAAAVLDPLRELLDEALAITTGDETAERVALLAARFGGMHSPRMADARPLLDALELAQRIDDPAALWRVGSLVWFVCEGWPDAGDRRSFLDEVTAWDEAAFPARAFRPWALLQAMAEALRTGDRAEADACLAALAQRSDEYAYIPAALLVAGGWFAEAEDAMPARDASLDPMWPLLIGEIRGQRMALEGRAAEVAARLRPLVEADLVPREWWARVAVYEATAGDHDAALAAAGRLGDEYLEPGNLSAAVIRGLAETAAVTNAKSLASRLLPRAGPWSGQYLMTSNACLVEGSADVAIGQCLYTLGRHDEAIPAYEAGIALEERLRFRALATRSRSFLAASLAAAGRTAAAREVRDRCIADATEIGMAPTLERAGAVGA